MLTCRELTETATDYLDGTLSLRRRAAVKFHLLMCKHCRSYVDQLATTIDLLRSAGQVRSDIEPDRRLIEAFRAAPK
jgi:predicted anti-sigma-YlaC factor YlaD